MKPTDTRRLAFSAILGALSLVCLWASAVLQTGTLALLGIATCFSAVTFWDCGNKYGLMHYAAVSILALLLVPKTAQLIAYIMFLGYYPFVRQKVRPVALRALIFTAVYAVSFLVFQNLLLPGFVLKAYHYILGLIGGEIVFFIFDYALFCFSIFYKERFSFFKN